MTDAMSRLVVGLAVIVVFTVFMLSVLIGLVDVGNTEMSKLVGALFGYLTGLITMVVARYFKNGA